MVERDLQRSSIQPQRTASLLITTSSSFSHARQEDRQIISTFKSFDHVFYLLVYNNCIANSKTRTTLEYLITPCFWETPRFSPVQTPGEEVLYNNHKVSKLENPDFSNQYLIHSKWQVPGSRDKYNRNIIEIK